jgi:hypothetical protein
MADALKITEYSAASKSPPASFCVSAIGSCRIVAPLRRAAQTSGFDLNQKGVFGYCHTAGEAVQQLQYLHSGNALPLHLKPVIAPSFTPERHSPSQYYFIEISSAKELLIDGHHVQLNYLTKHLKSFFNNRHRTREFWHLAKSQDNRARKTFLEADAAFRALDEDAQHMLRTLIYSETTPDGLHDYIAQISDLTKDALFVTHFNARKADGSTLRSRINFITMLKSELKFANAQVFDPSDYVEATGQSNALADEGTSLSHYAPSFEAFLARHWMTRYIEPRWQQHRRDCETPPLIDDTLRVANG